ncbi:hypothetical protein LZ554_008028 [Drepanopeziza brunnea f. sp. 'monogermtubi']|nr:hypothetical protein LZ554_008028 [Drepanopeziza brunnea f. sp. 'monogermtubi']
MHASFLLSALVAPLAVLAAPAENAAAIHARQEALVKPAPCTSIPGITPEETELRHKDFAQAFIFDMDIVKAFTYIREDYINHNPMAQNGSESAWSILSPVWANQTRLEVLGTRWISPQGWLNYIGDFGTIVDRFRWQEGCIAEHWDAGEQMPPEEPGPGCEV